VRLVDLGRMGFVPCAALQTELLERVVAGESPSTLLLVEHEPVMTLGANSHSENLLLSEAQYGDRGIAVEPTNRGGDVTFHGPGQLVIYPVFSLDIVGRDLHRWMRGLEETMIVTLASFGLTGYRVPSLTGCWVNERKVAAIGVKVRRWVSMHGIALNCDNDLSSFNLIVPCGIVGREVTSVSQELGRQITIEEAKPRVVAAFESVFSVRFDEQ